MFRERFENIKKKLQEQPAFKDSSFFLNRYDDNSLNFQGITDEYNTYAFVELVESPDGRTYVYRNTGKCNYNYKVSARGKLIAGFKCVDVPKAVDVLTNIIVNSETRILDVSTNAELIFKDETNQELQRNDLVLIRIFFEIEPYKAITNCETLICDDDCCS